MFIGPQAWKWPTKGRLDMSGQTTITRTLIAAIGALLMSTVAVGSAVGSAVGPAHASAPAIQASANA
jgi:hypothetical protein